MGASSIAAFYATNAWKQTRHAYAKSVGGLCERCAKRGKIVPGVEVHHKVRLTEQTVKDPKVALSWDNLELLCGECHHAEHRKSKRRWEFTEDGRLIADGWQNEREGVVDGSK